jgi:hypothetical protein
MSNPAAAALGSIILSVSAFLLQILTASELTLTALLFYRYIIVEMRKKLLLGIILLVGISMGAYAFGIGLQFNGHASEVFSPGVALCLSPKESIHLAFNWYFGSEKTLGMTTDFWLFNPRIASFGVGSLHFFLGGGLYANMLIDSNDFDFKGGVRFPLGLNVKLAKDVFEIYVQGAPSIGLRFYPSLGGDRFFLPFALGGRLWF